MWDENLYPKTEIQRGGIIQSILSEETHDIGQQQTGKINYPTHEEEGYLKWGGYKLNFWPYLWQGTTYLETLIREKNEIFTEKSSMERNAWVNNRIQL
jgi:hypothetical protein